MAEALARKSPKDTLLNLVGLPEVRALAALDRGQAARAIDLLEPARPYELSFQRSVVLHRARAYLGAGRAAEAARELEAVLKHRALCKRTGLEAFYRLELARALEKTGRREESRRAYQDLLGLWKDADPDLPLLQQAKAEYAKLG
jgi:predicted Zn-dependent protease